MNVDLLGHYFAPRQIFSEAVDLCEPFIITMSIPIRGYGVDSGNPQRDFPRIPLQKYPKHLYGWTCLRVNIAAGHRRLDARHDRLDRSEVAHVIIIIVIGTDHLGDRAGAVWYLPSAWTKAAWPMVMVRP
jgi:hypothetical protein